ncbi:MAG: phospholipase D-like domain-containing protein [Coxiellaceae bacterium]|nr:phospholipase D-like domain-containing protein [Coxiellaceae bacterium]
MSNYWETEETVFGDGSSFFHALISDITLATKTIDLETYIFSNDILGKKIIAALSDAAKRGVAIRALIDGVGTLSWRTTLEKTLEKAGIDTQVFHPLPWKLSHWKVIQKIPFLLRGIYLLYKLNSRNHRKTVIIDEKIAYLGSMNIDACHLSLSEGGKNWRDTGVRLANIDFSELQKAFDIAWSQRTITERIRDVFIHMRREPRIRLNYTRHRRRVLHKNLLRRMRFCQQRIWITNAYFVPDSMLLSRLKEAAKNGIDVRILLSKTTDISLVNWASATFYHDLLNAGIKIYIYLPGMLHAKSLILDDWMLIGSSNLNYRSLLHDLEADITLFTPAAKKALEQLFLNDLTHSRELTLAEWKNGRKWHQRILGRLALYAKYWI